MPVRTPGLLAVILSRAPAPPRTGKFWAERSKEEAGERVVSLRLASFLAAWPLA